jgi:hypothetical protein
MGWMPTDTQPKRCIPMGLKPFYLLYGVFYRNRRPPLSS